jgi:dimethylhistidine N-methyltransferase
MTISSRQVKEEPRCQLITLREPRDTFAEEVRQGLTATPKWLPCKYFYDDRGLALFDQICRLPEYYLTRTETEILEKQSAAIIAECPAPLALAELGSGSSEKTPLLIEPLLDRQGGLRYYPIDILPSALDGSGRRLVQAYPSLSVVGLVGEFGDGLKYLEKLKGESRLLAFLGSTVGNFNEAENERFFPRLRRALRPADRFLLGVDLHKDPAILQAAYDDSQGITAQFNLNLLVRINRELGADFDVDSFEHRAPFNEALHRIEMYLVSLRDQRVRLEALGLTVAFRGGETIHTENCYKHSVPAMTGLLDRHGFRVLHLYTDPAQWFGLFLVA